jgi:serine/threonine-protein kinase PRP4
MAPPDLSSDEGEITEATSLPQVDGNGDVDRTTRLPAKRSSRTPDYVGDGKSRLNDSPRGHKRPRDDRDSYGSQRGRDPRRFKVHYEAEPHRDSRRSHQSYDDLDRPSANGEKERPTSRSSNHRFGGRDAPPSRPAGYRQDDRNRRQDLDYDNDGYSDKRQRNRSRSPRGRGDRGRRDRGHFGRDRYQDQTEATKYSAQTERHQPGTSVSKRDTPAENFVSTRRDAKSDQGVSADRAADRHSTSRNRQVFYLALVFSEQNL